MLQHLNSSLGARPWGPGTLHCGTPHDATGTCQLVCLLTHVCLQHSPEGEFAYMAPLARSLTQTRPFNLQAPLALRQSASSPRSWACPTWTLW
jgi:hypothetical protein